MELLQAGSSIFDKTLHPTFLALYFLVARDVPGTSWSFCSPVLNSAIFISLGPFIGEWYLGTKIQYQVC